MKRGSAAQLRRVPLRKVGRRVRRERVAMFNAYEIVDRRAAGMCEAQVEGVCTGRGVEHHHVGPRSTHPHLRTDPTNIVLACPSCHRWIGDHPNKAAELGLHRKAET